MSGSKLALVVLILIAVLFAVGLGAGISQDDKHADGEDWRVKALRSALIRQQDLTAAELSGEHANGIFIIAHARPARVEIAASGTRVRTAKLILIQGTKVDVNFKPYDPDAISIHTTLDISKPFQVQVFQKGAQLTLTCQQGEGSLGQCKVQLSH